MAKKRPIIASLDVGSQTVSMVIAEHTSAGIEILGIGTAMSRGVRRGRLIDVEKTSEDISVALSEAELMAGSQIHQVNVAISGEHVHGTNSHGVVAIENGEVSTWAARRVIDAAQAVPLPAEQTVLHLLVREYVIDGMDGVPDPVGMRGVRLEANLHVISVAESALGNLELCCHKAGLSVGDFVASSMASAEAVLDHEEKELGVAVIDLGSGTVDISVFHNGSVVHSGVLTVASQYVTRDLSQCLETTMREAESIKIRYGAADESVVDAHGCVEVSGVGRRPPRVVSRKHIAEIIRPRLEEIFEMAADSITKSGYREMLTTGVVLTGGSAMMPGVVDVASESLGLPVRLGEPLGFGGLGDEVADPSWATAVGLIRGLSETDLSERPMPGWASRVLPDWIWRRWRGAT